MLGATFYHSLIRKYTTMVGTLFNDIKIERESESDPTNNQLIQVPLVYSPKEKVLARYNQDPNIDREFSVILPMISFELLDVRYDVERKTNQLNKIVALDTANPNKKKYQYNKVPYNFKFRVSVYVKNTEDGTRIVEQILPYFSPDISLTAELVPEMNIVLDIPIVLDGIELDDLYEGDFKTRKMFVWNLSITLKGYLFGPVKSNSIIKFANTDIYIAPSIGPIRDAVGNTGISVNIQTTPGLTANGTPTNNPNNSISPNLINLGDNWGFCQVIKEYI